MHKQFWQVILFFLIAGLAVALLAENNQDPFSLIEWALKSVWGMIQQVAHLFEGNKHFQEITHNPFPSEPLGSHAASPTPPPAG